MYIENILISAGASQSFEKKTAVQIWILIKRIMIWIYYLNKNHEFLFVVYFKFWFKMLNKILHGDTTQNTIIYFAEKYFNNYLLNILLNLLTKGSKV